MTGSAPGSNRKPCNAASVERLRLFPDPATGDGQDRIDFYESSIAHATTGERLLTIVSVGRGLRLTETKARELHDWIGAWLDAD